MNLLISCDLARVVFLRALLLWVLYLFFCKKYFVGIPRNRSTNACNSFYKTCCKKLTLESISWELFMKIIIILSIQMMKKGFGVEWHFIWKLWALECLTVLHKSLRPLNLLSISICSDAENLKQKILRRARTTSFFKKIIPIF